MTRSLFRDSPRLSYSGIPMILVLLVSNICGASRQLAVGPYCDEDSERPGETLTLNIPVAMDRGLGADRNRYPMNPCRFQTDE